MSYEVTGQGSVTYFNITFVARKLYCRFETEMSSFHQFICLSWMTSLHNNALFGYVDQLLLCHMRTIILLGFQSREQVKWFKPSEGEIDLPK